MSNIIKDVFKKTRDSVLKNYRIRKEKEREQALKDDNDRLRHKNKAAMAILSGIEHT